MHYLLYKSILLLIFLLTLNFKVVYSQVNVGLKTSIGDGKFASKNLAKNLAYQNQINPNIQTWDSRNHLGILYSLGGVMEFGLGKNISLLSEITFNHLNSCVEINYRRSNVNASGNGEVVKIESKAKVRTNFISLPVLVKYNISSSYILGGLRLNLIGNSKIILEEDKLTIPYSSGVEMPSSNETRSTKGSLDKTKLAELNLTFGLGKAFLIKKKQLMVDIRYNYPLTKTELYSTDPILDANSFESDKVFSQPGKSDAERIAPLYNLQDFRIDFMELSITYILCQKNKER